MKERAGDTQVNCDSSQFLLKKLNETDQCRIVRMSFFPIHSKSSNNLLKTFPIFNIDKKLHMPSFIVPADEDNYKEQQNLYVAIHNRKLQEATQEKNDIFVPKPSKKNSCCIICRCLFDDYLSHVTSPSHQALLRKSIFNDYIKQLCEMFKNEKGPQTKETIKCDQNLNKEPRKKRKVEKSKNNKYHVSGASTMIDSQALFQIKTASQIAV